MASAMAAVTVGMASPSLAPKSSIFASGRSPAFFHPMRTAVGSGTQTPRSQRCVVVRASASPSPSLKEQAVTGLTAAAVAAVLVIPDLAEAAQPGVSPSLKNFLFSIVAGGVVLGVLGGAVIAVANFDPVKRS